jgi:glutamate formiminotransferase / 5-formyltetrahydrofolate cyclo-ligase
MALIECVPNFSEGRRPAVVDQIIAAIDGVDLVKVMDRQSDAAHNRSVITFVGPHQQVIEAALRGVRAAARLIDLNQHEGAHPRFGAADVVPFVPIQPRDLPVCVTAAHELGRRIASELEIPVYYYEDAARSPERRNLATVRAGGFEGLREVIATDASRRPDEGPAVLHPTAGAVAVGARPPLVAYNVDLASDDLELARRIAGEVRERDGGLPKVKAIGLLLENGDAQVSMNLTDYRVTGLPTAFAAVRDRAAAAGVAVRRSEVIGLLPLDAVALAAAETLQAPGLTSELVVEARILEELS